MDEAESTQRLVRILESGADLETIESELEILAVDMGFPEPVARQWAVLLLLHGNDPERFALEQAKLLQSVAAEAFQSSDEPAEAVLGDIFASLDAASEVGKLFDRGEYRSALEKARDLVSSVDGLRQQFAALMLDDGSEDSTALLQAQTTGLVGCALMMLGSFSEAMTLLDWSIDVMAEHPKRDAATLPKLLLARSTLAAWVGDAGGAVRYVERAIDVRVTEILRLSASDAAMGERLIEADLDLAVMYDSLGIQLAEAGELDRAQDAQRRAFAAYDKVGEGQANDRLAMSIARCLQNVAVTLLRADTEKGDVIGVLTSALGVYDARDAERHPEAIACLGKIAAVHRLAGDIDQAAEALSRAATLAGDGRDQDPVLMSQLFLFAGEISAAAGASEQALEQLILSCRIQGTTILRVLPAAAESQRRRFLASIRLHFDVCLSLIVQRFPHAREAVANALTLVLQRKGLVAEASAGQRRAVLASHNEALAPMLGELLALEGRIANLAGTPPADSDFAKQAAVLATWQGEHEKLEVMLASQIPELAFERRLFEADAASVAGALPDGSALVELVRFRSFNFVACLAEGEPEWTVDRFVAFVLHAGKPDEVSLVDLAEAVSIDALIHAWRRDLSDGAGDSRVSGETLRRAVFDPCVAALGECTRLFIAPDGELALVPFEALPVRESDHLIDDFSISYVSTGRDLIRLDAAPPNSDGSVSALIIADPDYDSGSESVTDFQPDVPFERLEATRAEGVEVARLLGADLIAGAYAREGRLKGQRLPRLIHVATHGFFDPGDEQSEPASSVASTMLGFVGGGHASGGGTKSDPMLRSGLALAGANASSQGATPDNDVQDGILTAADVSGLDLLHTELVVLSACETGLGEVHAGEGVYGLRRAFAVAGARTLVISLWHVPDAQTKELMVDFYQRIMSGRPRAVALREAQLALKARWPDPWYWGAFICQGDPSAIAGLANLGVSSA